MAFTALAFYPTSYRTSVIPQMAYILLHKLRKDLPHLCVNYRNVTFGLSHSALYKVQIHSVRLRETSPVTHPRRVYEYSLTRIMKMFSV